MIIDLAKEEEEDKELIELLGGNKNKNNTNIIQDNKTTNKNNYINDIKNNFQKRNNMSFMKENNEPNIFGSKFNNNNFIYRKIDNFPSKRNIKDHDSITNQIEKEKNTMLKINKQKKIISANAGSINSHVSRLLNLKRIKNQNNINSITSKPLIETFIKGIKYFPSFNFKDKSKNNSKELRSLKINKIKKQRNISSSEKQIMYKSKYNFKQNNKNAYNDISSFNSLIHTNKYISNSINAQIFKEHKKNKYREGVLSAYNSNKNNSIPFLNVKRPLSNFNIDMKLNKGNLTNEKINPEANIVNLNLIKKNKSNDMRDNVNTAPSRKKNFHNYLSSEDRRNIRNKNYNYIFNKMNLYEHKYHQIKIDRNFISNNVKESIYKKDFLNYINLRKDKFPKI